jgi:hypothetical protein
MKWGFCLQDAEFTIASSMYGTDILVKPQYHDTIWLKYPVFAWWMREQEQLREHAKYHSFLSPRLEALEDIEPLERSCVAARVLRSLNIPLVLAEQHRLRLHKKAIPALEFLAETSLGGTHLLRNNGFLDLADAADRTYDLNARLLAYQQHTYEQSEMNYKNRYF